jgi:hypothetical protein
MTLFQQVKVEMAAAPDFQVRQADGTLFLEIHERDYDGSYKRARVLRFNPQHGYYEENGRRIMSLNRDAVAFLRQAAPWTASRYA